MPSNAISTSLTRTTSSQAVIPFYAYAAICLLAATFLLFFSSRELTEHYFQPKILAITHLMALGWATMIILGASHQLIPVLVEKELYSNRLATITFILSAPGIPLLVYGFYTFNLGFPLITGGIFVILGIITFLINIALTVKQTGRSEIHALFIFTASLWLLLTALLGLLLALNFTYHILSKGSLHYLSLHAHLGISGWFLLMVTGVGSKLVPMFMISKFQNTRQLQWIYALINIGLIAFIIQFQYFSSYAYLLPMASITLAVSIFGIYCFKAYKQRIRKKVDRQMKLSLMSVGAMLFPLFLLFIIAGFLLEGSDQKLVTIYGITIFFGWLTAIILGMTFKTLPFIVWNRLHEKNPANDHPQDPRYLFNEKVFVSMAACYITGLAFLTAGVCTSLHVMIKFSAALLILSAILYNLNVWKMVLRKKF